MSWRGKLFSFVVGLLLLSLIYIEHSRRSGIICSHSCSTDDVKFNTDEVIAPTLMTALNQSIASSAPTLPDKKPLHSFHHKSVRTADEIMKNAWVTTLKDLLNDVSVDKQVTIVFATADYTGSILNWLIAAQVRIKTPIDNILICCLDTALVDILDKRRIPVVYIDTNTIVYPKQIGFYRRVIFMTRLFVIRLANYWGYDVISYDSDAIVLKNPQPLLLAHQSSDVISAAATFPDDLWKKWTFTCGMGFIVFRSTPKIELMWDSTDGRQELDDQVMVNRALDSCNMQWEGKVGLLENQSVDGTCDTGLRATVLPLSAICRRKCNQRREEDLYIWHQFSEQGGQKKMDYAKRGKRWYLRSDWKKLSQNNSLIGKEWLASISTTIIA